MRMLRRLAFLLLPCLAALAAIALTLGPVGAVAAAALAAVLVLVVAPAVTPVAGTPLRRRALFASLGLLVLLAAVALTFRLRYGGGQPYPDVTAGIAPLLPDAALEPVVVSEEPIGNVAVTPDGRVFYTIHPESRPTGARLLEWKDGKATPWPSVAMQARLGLVLGLATDGRQLWAIEHGNHGTSPPRLFAFDLATGALTHEHAFADAELGSFYQDLEVSHDGRTVYIADASFWRRNPAVVVYDVPSGVARVRLRDHPSVYPQEWIIHTPAKQMTFFGGLVSLQTGIDGLVLSADDQWLYYAAMSHDGLFRVPTAALRDPSTSDAAVAAAVERLPGKKPLSDGLGIDAAGDILVTDVEHGAVVRMSSVPSASAASGASGVVFKTPKVRWADGVTFGPDGWLYLADSAIPEQMLQSKDHIHAEKPYYVWRIRTEPAGIAGVAGR
jgi:sugar lactone lactonase YvrE